LHSSGDDVNELQSLTCRAIKTAFHWDAAWPTWYAPTRLEWHRYRILFAEL